MTPAGSQPVTATEQHWIRQLISDHYGLTPEILQVLPGEADRNFYVKGNDGKEWVLKIARPGTAVEGMVLQRAILLHLQESAVSELTPRLLPGKSGEYYLRVNGPEGEPRLVRLLSWSPGRLYAQVRPHSEALLTSLGKACGRLSRSLQDFDHPAAHRFLKWDPAQASWLGGQLHQVEGAGRQVLARDFYDLFEKKVEPALKQLRYAVNHNDLNDYNILVEDGAVTGFIDFGDAVYTPLINELAIALAYALMHHPDPLAAAIPVVRAYHREFPLTEKELALLYPLIAIRLLVSVVNSAINRKAEPDNEYLLISEQPAWTLLEKLRSIPPALAHYSFRWACGMEACPAAIPFRRWIDSKPLFSPLVDTDLQSGPVAKLDLSVGSLDLGNNQNFDDIETFDHHIQEMLREQGARVGVGGYGEIRPFYTSDTYITEGNEGPQWRTIHLGLDIWMPAETPIYAPLDGTVYSVQDNAGERNYGPTIILKHRIDEELSFYTLYGHLSRISLSDKIPGKAIKQGERIATIGPRPENGNWPPHLHFQVMLDPLDMKGDFPGVGFAQLWPVWRSLCPDPNPLAGLPPAGPVPEPDKAAILYGRKQHLGPNLSISYREPLHILRGYKQYLYDQQARRYLDTVNNVAHVGHEHPRVVRAAQRQMAVLNTNTRYLHEQLVRYAEALLARLPAPLEVVYFVNSGSEANELALRLARTCTGRKDMLAIEVGYHGHTTACVDVSSYKFSGKGGRGAPATTHVVPIPNPYRGPFRREDPGAGEKYAAYIGETIKRLQATDTPPAGFIAESILSCGGQVVPPQGYLSAAYRQVREAGGLCIGDEVQTGFGRVGTHFWAFEQQGVVPDIVTMGKPIGNGHPLAAVATTRSIAEAFDNGMEYFNTFGGNPVSCAVGSAVLQVIEEEGLQQNALQTGAYLNDCLHQLQELYPIIGDVRGPGLFQGFELVTHPEKRTPATRQAGYLANRMRAHGILMSTDGPFENVLKIKPPMCFSPQNVDFLTEMLDKVFKEDPMR